MNKFEDYRAERMIQDRKIADRIRNAPNREKQIELVTEILLLGTREQTLDDRRRKRVETEYYELLCNIAKENGGRVELDIDENLCFGALSYRGSALTIDSAFDPKIDDFTALLKESDTIDLSAKGMEFELKLTFDLTEQSNKAANAEKLEALTEQLFRLVTEVSDS